MVAGRPENGIDPERWEYDRLAFVRPDAVRVVETRRPYPGLRERMTFPASVFDAMSLGHSLEDAGPWAFDRAGAVVFSGSARGSIVAVARNPDPTRLEHVALLCEHWADVHFDAAAIGSRPVSSEASLRTGAVGEPTAPDWIVAELDLRIYPPEGTAFEELVEQARAEVAERELVRPA